MLIITNNKRIELPDDEIMLVIPKDREHVTMIDCESENVFGVFKESAPTHRDIWMAAKIRKEGLKVCQTDAPN